MNIQESYILTCPSNQNIVDLFQGEWSSSFPKANGLDTEPGLAQLFEDPRIDWAEVVFGGFGDLEVLELGPLEGGHSYMLQKKGVARVTAIEANTRAFIKCLCTKEIMDLSRVKFMLGDMMAYLENNKQYIDLVIASGVLYHMVDPVRLIELISKVADRAFIWTHYYDETILAERNDFHQKFKPLTLSNNGGLRVYSSIYSYNEAIEWSGFCGGPLQVSRWLTLESIIDALKFFGYNNIVSGFEQPDHPNGPAIAICASRE